MKVSIRVLALASVLGLGACTSLLGVDGDYGPGGAGGGASSGGPATSTITSSADATSVTASSASTSSVGGEGGGSGGGDGGAGGQAPSECPLCRIDTIDFAEPEGRRPRIAHLAPELRFTYLDDDLIQLRGEAFPDDGEQAAGAVDALWVTGGPELRLLWLRTAGRNTWELMENGEPLLGGATTQPTFDAAVNSDGLLIGTYAQDDGSSKPVLFLCDGGGCTANLVCPAIERVGPRRAALTRRDNAIAFARMCDGDLLVTDRAGMPLLAPDLGSIGADELTVTYAPGQVVALTITSPRAPNAGVQMHFAAGSGQPIPIPGAHSPALVATDDAVMAVLATGPDDAMVAIHCEGLSADTCDVVSLTGAPVTGGDSPSLGLVGSPPTEVWLAWEQAGVVQVGRLGP